MRKLLYASKFAKAYLSTKHARCSYGLPVLEVAGEAYGPADVLPSGLTAGALVQTFLDKGDPSAGRWGARTKQTLHLADLFLAPVRG